ncbi:MAG: hypothetical protein JXB35_10515 [Anaerolineae bacterium]|nr:hypothetical protein [Anaerolineae bacterium]
MDVARGLAARQIPTYRSIQELLSWFHLIGSFGVISQTLFPNTDLHLTKDPIDAITEIIGCVASDLFPLDMSYLEEMYWAGQQMTLVEIFTAPIPFVGWGISLEELIEIPDYAMPLLVLATQHRELDPAVANIAVEWWEYHGHRCPDMVWAEDPLRALETLDDLPEPLNGLATVFLSLTEIDPNPFLTTPPLWERGLFEVQDFYWQVPDLLFLRDAWQAAKPRVEKLEKLQDWYLKEGSIDEILVFIENMERNAQ